MDTRKPIRLIDLARKLDVPDCDCKSGPKKPFCLIRDSWGCDERILTTRIIVARNRQFLPRRMPLLQQKIFRECVKARKISTILKVLHIEEWHHVRDTIEVIRELAEFGYIERDTPGRCDCPFVPGPPCEHIKAVGRTMTMDYEEFTQLLYAADPDGMESPPLPDERMFAASKMAAINGMEQRHGSKETPERHIRHPDDLVVAKLDKLVRRVERTRNGSPMELSADTEGTNEHGSDEYPDDDLT